MDRNVCIIAGGMSKWGVRSGSQRDFFQEAAKACYEDNPLVNPKEIDGLLVASAYTSALRTKPIWLRLLPSTSESSPDRSALE